MMANIGLIDVDGRNFPNLALMKLSAWHKALGEDVEWYMPFTQYDIVYKSKVFGFSEDWTDPINSDKVISGGTGYCFSFRDGKEYFDKDKDVMLPQEIEHIYPDYTLYPQYTSNTAYGFLTRGCPRECHFCIVGKKEGLMSRKVANLDEFWHGQKKYCVKRPKHTCV